MSVDAFLGAYMVYKIRRSVGIVFRCKSRRKFGTLKGVHKKSFLKQLLFSYSTQSHFNSMFLILFLLYNGCLQTSQNSSRPMISILRYLRLFCREFISSDFFRQSDETRSDIPKHVCMYGAFLLSHLNKEQRNKLLWVQEHN